MWARGAARQVADFCREVVGTEEVTLVGNSIGCLACMAAAALMPGTKGLALLNSAGNPDVEEEVRGWVCRASSARAAAICIVTSRFQA